MATFVVHGEGDFFPVYLFDSYPRFYAIDGTLPIRLTQTPTRCRVDPSSGIKLGIGRRLNAAGDAEQRAEGVERVETPVEAERELIEVGL